jgi:hypothetical protein
MKMDSKLNWFGRFLKRIAPVAVLTAALSFSAWSLFFVSRHLGAPIPVAVVVSTIFDGGAVYLADLAADHTREGDSGFGPRMCVWILALASAWLNRLHAVYGHYPTSSELLWMAPPIVAVVIYDFTIRFLHRKTLRATGRIPSAMPRFDTASWVLFPIKTMKDFRKVITFRRDVTTSLATGQLLPGTAGPLGVTAATLGQLPAGITPEPRDVRDWARRSGLNVAKTGPVSPEITAQYLRALAAGNAAPIGELGQGGEPDSDQVADVPGPRGEFAESTNAEVDAAFRAVNGHKPTDRESLS